MDWKEDLEKLEEDIEKLYTDRDEQIKLEKTRPVAMQYIHGRIEKIIQEYKEKIEPLERKRKYIVDRNNAPNINVHNGIGDNISGHKKITNRGQDVSNKYYWYFLIPLVVFIVGYIITEGKLPGILNGTEIPQLINRDIATTTPKLLDIYERAFSYDILAERQKFLNRYIGSNIYEDGTISEISTLGDRYILEIKFGSYSILCPQENTGEFEKIYPFLKGRSVRFYGIFTYTNYFGYDENKLVIDSCSFERK